MPCDVPDRRNGRVHAGVDGLAGGELDAPEALHIGNVGYRSFVRRVPLSHTRCMTAVRRNATTRGGSKKATAQKVTGRSAATASKSPARRGQAAKATPPRRQASTRGGGASHVAQVRLQADELAVLRQVMRQLSLPSMSEALREAIRLLIREATEAAAAEELRRFYGEKPVPVPEGVIPATKKELAAADEVQW
jgi:hypothetical protein